MCELCSPDFISHHMVAAIVAAGFAGSSAFVTGTNLRSYRSVSRSVVSMQVTEELVAQPQALAKVRGRVPFRAHHTTLLVAAASWSPRLTEILTVCLRRPMSLVDLRQTRISRNHIDRFHFYQ